MPIIMEQTDLCVTENFESPYPISVDCPPGSIVTQECIDAPLGVNEDDVKFQPQGNRNSFVILPPFEGKYYITAHCKIPI